MWNANPWKISVKGHKAIESIEKLVVRWKTTSEWRWLFQQLLHLRSLEHCLSFVEECRLKLVELWYANVNKIKLNSTIRFNKFYTFINQTINTDSICSQLINKTLFVFQFREKFWSVTVLFPPLHQWIAFSLHRENEHKQGCTSRCLATFDIYLLQWKSLPSIKVRN